MNTSCVYCEVGTEFMYIYICIYNLDECHLSYTSLWWSECTKWYTVSYCVVCLRYSVKFGAVVTMRAVLSL
jgi:hypothetical protein